MTLLQLLRLLKTHKLKSNMSVTSAGDFIVEVYGLKGEARVGRTVVIDHVAVGQDAVFTGETLLTARMKELVDEVAREIKG